MEYTFTNTSLGVQRIEMAYNLSKLIRTPEDASVVAQVRDSVKSWFVQDHLGSTIALTDSAGNVARSYGYDVDGDGTTSGSGPESWIKYAGGHDIGGGLYHFGARFYQPSTARWTQMDPLQQPGDLRQHNRYGYVGGNPVNGVDPSGLICDACKRRLSTIKRGAQNIWNRAKDGGTTGGTIGVFVGAYAGSGFEGTTRGRGAAIGAAFGGGVGVAIGTAGGTAYGTGEEVWNTFDD